MLRLQTRFQVLAGRRQGRQDIPAIRIIHGQFQACNKNIITKFLYTSQYSIYRGRGRREGKMRYYMHNSG